MHWREKSSANVIFSILKKKNNGIGNKFDLKKLKYEYGAPKYRGHDNFRKNNQIEMHSLAIQI